MSTVALVIAIAIAVYAAAGTLVICLGRAAKVGDQLGESAHADRQRRWNNDQQALADVQRIWAEHDRDAR